MLRGEAAANKKKKNSRIQSKLVAYIWACVIPFIVLFVFAAVQLISYYQKYDRLVRNITSANLFNMDFKDSMDEMMYRIIIGSANWTDPERKLEGEDPKGLIRPPSQSRYKTRRRSTPWKA